MEQTIEIRLDEAEIEKTQRHVDAALEKMGRERRDANESVFLAQQLEYMKAREIATIYPERRARRFIPIGTDVPAGAETFSYRVWDYIGAAKLVADGAVDIPLADAYARKETGYVRTMALGFTYSLEDIDRAVMTGTDLPAEKQRAVVKGFEKGENDILFFGDPQFKLQGFLNAHAANGGNIGIHNLPSDGTGSSRSWANKTPTQIIRDLDEMVESVISQSKNQVVPTVVILPRSRWAIINNTPVSLAGGSDKTIKTWWEANHPGITLDWLYELETAGVGNATRALCYKRDPEVVEGQIPMQYDQLPPQSRGLGFLVPARSRIGGVAWTMPLGALYFDGI